VPKPRPHLYSVLLLEDDLEVCGKLLLALHRIEPFLAPYDLDLTLLSTSDAVAQLVNAHPERQFDVILLDRDCKMSASFHILDLSYFDPERIISISSTPMWNQEAKMNGITNCVPKSFNALDEFAEEAAQKVFEMLQSQQPC
jgi:hypothetical protein